MGKLRIVIGVKQRVLWRERLRGGGACVASPVHATTRLQHDAVLGFAIGSLQMSIVSIGRQRTLIHTMGNDVSDYTVP